MAVHGVEISLSLLPNLHPGFAEEGVNIPEIPPLLMRVGACGHAMPRVAD